MTTTRDRAAEVGAVLPLDRLRAKKPMQQTLSICCDPELVDELLKARAAVELAKLEERAAEEVAQLEDMLAAADAAVRSTSVDMSFRSIGRKAYEALVMAHPPTDEQNTEYQELFKQNAPYNGETFPIALIAASCVEPKLTIDDVHSFYDNWNAAELLDLFQAALTVNTQSRRLDMGND